MAMLQIGGEETGNRISDEAHPS